MTSLIPSGTSSSRSSHQIDLPVVLANGRFGKSSTASSTSGFKTESSRVTRCLAASPTLSGTSSVPCFPHPVALADRAPMIVVPSTPSSPFCAPALPGVTFPATSARPSRLGDGFVTLADSGHLDAPLAHRAQLPRSGRAARLEPRAARCLLRTCQTRWTGRGTDTQGEGHQMDARH